MTNIHYRCLTQINGFKTCRGTRPVSDVRFPARIWRVGSGASAPPLRRRIRFSRLYSLHSLSLSTAQRLSCPILATPPCHGAHQNSIPARLRRAGKSRPVFAVQPQQTLANLTTPACSLESDLPSGGRPGTARNQRLALLQLASPSRPAR